MGIGRLIQKLALPLAVGSFGALYFLERRRPLRRPVEPQATRTARNLTVAGAAAVAVYLIEQPIASHAAQLIERRRIGLLKMVRLPKWFEQLAAVLILDYTLYIWHVLTHKIPALWRFHVVHHVDLDLDTTTSLRFHFGEITISVAWRWLQIMLIGVSPASLRIWQALVLPSVMFHHSNLELPRSLERLLSKVVVTPRLHGIHHSVVRQETNSNWSSGLAIWDIVHGTFRDIDQHRGVRIGVPAYRVPEELTIGKLLEMPFVEQRPTWKLPAGEIEGGH
ncbi:MAG: sterol desaturase family protein [Pyrinomonadaceae bacterium]